jgi:hypothetical protein
MGKFVKGTPKHPRSGKKKGTPNKVTALKNELAKSDINSENHAELMKMLYENAKDMKSVLAARAWFDENNKIIDRQARERDRSIPDKIETIKLKTLEDIDNTAELITRKAFCKELDLPTAKQALEILSARKVFKEAVLDPYMQQLLDKLVDEEKHAV